MKAFHDLQQHFIRIRDFTGRKESTSVISSTGRIIGDDTVDTATSVWEIHESAVVYVG